MMKFFGYVRQLWPKKTFSKFLFFSLLLISHFQSANGMSLDWSGAYRFEYINIDRPSLADPYMTKSYGLNFLYLSPKIIASDGINIISRFDVLNSQDPAYQNSQTGQIFGSGLPSTTTTDDSRKNTTTRTQNTSNLVVSQLYLNVEHEYGSLLLGRAPLDFGLGVTYSSGKNPFDHWYNTQDLVAYKFIVGNMFFMPMLGRTYDQDPGQGNTIQDEMLMVQYDNEESGNLIGFVLNKRKASYGVNDAPPARYLRSPLTGSVMADYSAQRTNFILGKKWDGFSFKLEGAFITADTGVRSSNDSWVAQSGYGLAAELYFPRPEEKIEWTVKLGMATGDDPSTADYEGFQFDRNYDVAMLLFNHRLGQRDFLTTDLIKDKSTGRNVSNSLDDEAIGNTWYLSPNLKYRINDKLDWMNSITYAQLWTNPTTSGDVNRELGWEYDASLVYRPREKVTWINEMGLLFPGHGFKDGQTGLGNSTVLGISTKVSISF